MMTTSLRLADFVTIVVLILGLSETVASQTVEDDDNRIAAMLYVGESKYDLSGTGTSFIFTTELTAPISDPFDLSASITYLPTVQDFLQIEPTVDYVSVDKPYILFDLQPQITTTMMEKRMKLYLGTGVTLGIDLTEDRYRYSSENSRVFFMPFLLTTGGIRFGITEHLMIGALGRWRYPVGRAKIGHGFPGDALEWSLGLGWAF